MFLALPCPLETSHSPGTLFLVALKAVSSASLAVAFGAVQALTYLCTPPCPLKLRGFVALLHGKQCTSLGVLGFHVRTLEALQTSRSGTWASSQAGSALSQLSV